jgi:hypothetical protein
VGSILAVVAIGLFLQHLEVENPIARMRAELRTVARGEAVKLNDHRYGGGFGGIARDVNAAVEHYSMSSLSGATAALTLGSGAVAADAPPPAGSPFAHSSGPGFGMNAPAAATAGSSGFPAPPPPAAFAPPAFPPPARPKGGPGGGPPPAAPGSLFDTAASAGAIDPAAEDKHVQQVYLEFLATKQQCGESAAGLTLEKFRQRLQENKATLMAKHDCRTVRFSVYVKDGKASLRATPVK